MRLAWPLTQDIATGKGWCRATLPVTARLQNAHGQLHAGCYPALVDVISSAALATVLDVQAVSVNITVDYLGDVAVGQAVEIEAVVIRTGRSLAFSDIFIRYVHTKATLTECTLVQVQR